MKILLTGVTGYIGQQFLRSLLEQGHDLIFCLQHKKRFFFREKFENNFSVIDVDFIKPESLAIIPNDIDVAYYFSDSTSCSSSKYDDEIERISVIYFIEKMNKTNAGQIIYFSRIAHDKSSSKYFSSRKAIEDIFATSLIPITILRASLPRIASFEILCYLVNKLPGIVSSKWLTIKEPIVVTDVLEFLVKSLLDPFTYNECYMLTVRGLVMESQI